jgi:UDP-N-acetylmuramoylalanine--D-glutamate ligase
VRRVVAFGASGPELAAAFRAAGVSAEAVGTVPAAVERAFASMDEGEALLFSPACASFDAYRNFRERASAFRQALERH